jgi:hypothetical protein
MGGRPHDAVFRGLPDRRGQRGVASPPTRHGRVRVRRELWLVFLRRGGTAGPWGAGRLARASGSARRGGDPLCRGGLRCLPPLVVGGWLASGRSGALLTLAGEWGDDRVQGHRIRCRPWTRPARSATSGPSARL